ncbi:MAG: EAL domain-containing protein [Ardenticatenaceae bacterium]|nr:EAL domain-containing protein [Ardenticatenaceae bacterium]
MTVRKKSVLISMVTLCGLIVALSVAARFIVLRSFLEVERQETEANLQRVLDALSNELVQLNRTTRDWSAWDDSYAFVAGELDSYATANLADATFANLQLNLVAFVNTSGDLIYGNVFDLATEESRPLPQSFRAHLTPSDLLLNQPDTESSRVGLLSLAEGPVLVAARPIVTSEGKGPIRGTLIFGRFLDAEKVQQLAETLHLALAIYPFTDPEIPLGNLGAPVSGATRAPFLVRPLSVDTVAGYTVLNDLYGQPSLVLQVESPRAVYQQGQLGLRYFLLALLAAGLVFSVVFHVSLDRWVLSRLAHSLAYLRERVGRIAGHDLAARFGSGSGDELMDVAQAISDMVVVLEETFSELQQSEERYALATRGANDGLWDWDLQTNQIYYSTRWKAMLGYSEAEIGDEPDEWFRRVAPEDSGQLWAALSAHLEGITHHFEHEYRILHKGGQYRWVLARGLAVRPGDGSATRMAGSQTDITERKRMEEQLLHDALHDALTGLPNRVLFLDRLTQALERAKRREGTSFAVLFMDVDHFKLVNDSLGHIWGDELLVAIARRLEAVRRAVDTVARLGGDEFVMLLDDLEGTADAITVAERIHQALGPPLGLGGQEVFVSVSIGIVLSTDGLDAPEDLLRDADIAMYRAKALGKARSQLFDPTMRDHVVARLLVETDLRRAVERQEFRLHYQPILALASGRITGFEALVRWQHPERGLLAPGAFIAAAEENGLIVPIGEWVLREACRQLARWQQEFATDPPLTISVNLSSRQLMRPDLVERIDQIVQEAGVDPATLKLEITESIVMDNYERTAKILSDIRSRGIQIFMDDFGTGYSSLSYLSHFPIQAIKIDRSFVQEMVSDGNHLEIVRTILVLARELDLSVLAEGVETREQMDQLVALGCDLVQGYFISKPVAPEEAQRLLAAAPVVSLDD